MLNRRANLYDKHKAQAEAEKAKIGNKVKKIISKLKGKK